MSYLNNFKTELTTRLKNGSTNKKKSEEEKDKKDILNNETVTSIKIKPKNEDVDGVANDNSKAVIKTVTENNTKNNQKPQTIVSGPVGEASKNDDPVEKLKELEERYELLEFYEVPDSLGLTKKDEPTFDEKEERSKLEAKYDAIYNVNKDKLTNDYKQAVSDLTGKKESYELASKNASESINEVFDSEAKTLENQAIKRGLARSSIILNQLSDVESRRAGELINTMNNLAKNLGKVEEKIAEGKSNLDAALEKLDIEKADKIETELEDIYLEYQDTLNDVIEFNNNVNKLEAEYKIKYEQAKADYKDSILELTQYGYDEYKKKLEMSKYDYMISYLSQFNKDDAFEVFFRNNNFKDLLGEYYYQKIVDYLYSRL